jgi:predicted 3-demethylubiquinone-9 3-methyltransferase (glyoxalase superfamily)
MPIQREIVPCLWFDTQAEEAAKLYCSIFEDSKIEHVAYYGKAGFDIHRRPAGSVMTVSFTLRGSGMTALNGGPQFKFNEAISLQVLCDTQQEIDHYWSSLLEGGSEGPCGWLKDKFGVSWQVVPSVLERMLRGDDPAKVERVTNAFLQMKKFDIAALERAHVGK